MSNSVNLSLDVTKTGIQNPLIKVRQGDGGFETLHTTVTSNGEPMDLQGWTITFMGTTAGNHKIVDTNVTVVEAPNGIFDYTPSKAWGMDIGEFKIAYFKFVKGDGSASSANFRVNVIEAVDLTQEEAKNYISVVDTTIAEINQHLTDSLAHVTQSIADANNNANTVSSNVNALGNRVDDYNNKLAAVKVGGRNLMLGTRDWSGGTGRWTRIGTLTNDTYRGTTVTAISVPWTGPTYMVQNAGVLEVGKTYTFSTYVRNTSDTDTQIAYYYDTSIITPSGITKTLPAHTDWTRLSGTFTVIKDPTTSIYGLRWESQKSVANGQIQFAGYKLEEGNIPTDWSPAPEDAPSNDAQLVHKTGTETIAGDKTFTGNVNFSGNVGLDAYVKKTNVLPAEARDFNYLATHMKTYQGYWYNGSESIANAPTSNWTWSIVEIIAGNSEKTGLIRTMRFGTGAVYSANINGGAIQRWSLIADDANVVHNTGNETIAGDKTFTGKVTATNFNETGVPQIATATTTFNGLTFSFTRVGSSVYVTTSTTAVTTAIQIGWYDGIIPLGYRTTANVEMAYFQKPSSGGFVSVSPSGRGYFNAALAIGDKPRIVAYYPTTDPWPAN